MLTKQYLVFKYYNIILYKYLINEKFSVNIANNYFNNIMSYVHFKYLTYQPKIIIILFLMIALLSSLSVFDK